MSAPARPGLWTSDYALNLLGTVGFFGSFFYLLSVLPDYVDSIGGAKWQVGLIVGGFGILPIFLRPFVGRWSDRGHRKRLQRAGLVVTVIALALMVFSEDVLSLFVLRIVQGLGVTMFPTAAASLAAEISPPSRRGEGLGYFGMATGVAQMVTPALGVVIAEVWGFDAVFLVAAATAALTLVVIQPVREPPRQQPVVGASTALIPRRAIFPMLIFLSVTFSFSAAATFLPLLGDERGLGNVGLFFLVSGAGAIVSRPIAGRTSDRVGRVPVVVPGLLATWLSMWLLALAGTPPLMWLAGAAAGLGLGGGAHRPAVARRRPRPRRPEGARDRGAADGVGHRRAERRDRARSRRHVRRGRRRLLGRGRDHARRDRRAAGRRGAHRADAGTRSRRTRARRSQHLAATPPGPPSHGRSTASQRGRANH